MFGIMIVLSEIFFHGTGKRIPVEKLSSVYSNCGFIGFPLIDGIFGAEGIFYMTAYTTVFNLLFWTHGVWAMGSGGNVKSTLKSLFTPAIVAVFLGLFLFVAQIRLPETLAEPLDMIADMNAPLAMIVAGINLAQADFLKSLKKIRIYCVCLLRLVFFPLVGILILAQLPLDFKVLFTVFIGMACPSGAMVIMFAERYGKDALYASEIFTLTTILCAGTIPVLSILAVKMFVH